MSIIKKILTAIAPAAALRREKANFALSQMRKYDAASRGKRARNWNTAGGSADREIVAAGTTIRNRARDMVRNNSYVRKAAQVMRTSVVGQGVKLSIRATRITDTRRAKMMWKNWAESTDCDYYGRKNFYSIQRLIANAVFVDGEAFVVKRRNGNTPSPIQLQVLEADYLDYTKSVAQLASGNRIDAGIETDQNGRKVAYWMFPQHPQDNTTWRSLTSNRVPATEVLHIYQEERPGQLRGVSALVASMFRLRDFDEYEDAQLIRQKIAACFSVFITGDGDVRPGDPSDNTYPLERVEPGIIEYLPPGKGVEFGRPPETTNYDEYSRKVLQGAAAGVGLTYESLTGDLSNVNFSSGRMGWIEMSRNIREWQDDVIISQLCIPVWKWFVEAMVVSNNLKADAVFDTNWTAPRREMIDPVKETKGLSEGLRAGLNSWQDTIRELGKDPDEVRAQMAEDMANFDTMGAKPTIDPRYDPKRNDSQQSEENTPDEG